MGQHKYNPTAIAAAKGELPPKQKSNMSKKEQDALLKKLIEDKTGITAMKNAMGGFGYYG